MKNFFTTRALLTAAAIAWNFFLSVNVCLCHSKYVNRESQVTVVLEQVDLVVEIKVNICISRCEPATMLPIAYI